MKSRYWHLLRADRALRRTRKRLAPVLAAYDRAVRRSGDSFFPNFKGSGAAQVPHIAGKAAHDALNSKIESAWNALAAHPAYRHTPPRLVRVLMGEKRA
jgi:hypothetical protein